MEEYNLTEKLINKMVIATEEKIAIIPLNNLQAILCPECEAYMNYVTINYDGIHYFSFPPNDEIITVICRCSNCNRALFKADVTGKQWNEYLAQIKNENANFL